MQKYEKPICEVLVFQDPDVIRTSLNGEEWILDETFEQK